MDERKLQEHISTFIQIQFPSIKAFIKCTHGEDMYELKVSPKMIDFSLCTHDMI